jgi:hypothetical protein
MAITEENRHHLYTRLEQVLGPEEATVLMEHLPPVGWADVATKRDLEHLETRIDAKLEAMELRWDSTLDRRLADFTRTIVFAVFAAQAALAGLVVAIAG